MIMTPHSIQLPVGQVWTPPILTARGRYKRVLVIKHPQGEYIGPIYVVREVTQAEYCDWFEREHGERIRRTHVRSKSFRFWEISID